jgi:transcriptional regulator with XRE-family HTH domain
MARTVTARSVYALPRGLYARIARQLGIDPSYVSRVAHGHRRNDRISKALDAELRKLLAQAQKSIRKPSKK